MKVKELIAYLEALNQPEARVFEENGSELRELNDDDVSYHVGGPDGMPIDEAEYSEDEWEALEKVPGIVVLGAWS